MYIIKLCTEYIFVLYETLNIVLNYYYKIL